MVVAQFVAQDVVNGIGERGAFARTKVAMVSKEFRHDGVSRVIEFKGEPYQFGTGF